MTLISFGFSFFFQIAGKMTSSLRFNFRYFLPPLEERPEPKGVKYESLSDRFLSYLEADTASEYSEDEDELPSEWAAGKEREDLVINFTFKETDRTVLWEMGNQCTAGRDEHIASSTKEQNIQVVSNGPAAIKQLTREQTVSKRLAGIKPLTRDQTVNKSSAGNKPFSQDQKVNKSSAGNKPFSQDQKVSQGHAHIEPVTLEEESPCCSVAPDLKSHISEGKLKDVEDETMKLEKKLKKVRMSRRNPLETLNPRSDWRNEMLQLDPRRQAGGEELDEVPDNGNGSDLYAEVRKQPKGKRPNSSPSKPRAAKNLGTKVSKQSKDKLPKNSSSGQGSAKKNSGTVVSKQLKVKSKKNSSSEKLPDKNLDSKVSEQSKAKLPNNTPSGKPNRKKDNTEPKRQGKEKHRSNSSAMYIACKNHDTLKLKIIKQLKGSHKGDLSVKEPLPLEQASDVDKPSQELSCGKIHRRQQEDVTKKRIPSGSSVVDRTKQGKVDTRKRVLPRRWGPEIKKTSPTAEHKKVTANLSADIQFMNKGNRKADFLGDLFKGMDASRNFSETNRDVMDVEDEDQIQRPLIMYSAPPVGIDVEDEDLKWRPLNISSGPAGGSNPMDVNSAMDCTDQGKVDTRQRVLPRRWGPEINKTSPTAEHKKVTANLSADIQFMNKGNRKADFLGDLFKGMDASRNFSETNRDVMDMDVEDEDQIQRPLIMYSAPPVSIIVEDEDLKRRLLNISPGPADGSNPMDVNSAMDCTDQVCVSSSEGLEAGRRNLVLPEALDLSVPWRKATQSETGVCLQPCLEDPLPEMDSDLPLDMRLDVSKQRLEGAGHAVSEFLQPGPARIPVCVTEPQPLVAEGQSAHPMAASVPPTTPALPTGPLQLTAAPAHLTAAPVHPTAASVPSTNPALPTAPLQLTAAPAHLTAAPVHPTAASVPSTNPALPTGPLQLMAGPLRPVALPAHPMAMPTHPMSVPIHPMSAPIHPMSAPVHPMSAPVHPTAASVPSTNPALPTGPLQLTAGPLRPVALPAHPMAAPVRPMAMPAHPMSAPIHPMSAPVHHYNQWGSTQWPTPFPNTQPPWLLGYPKHDEYQQAWHHDPWDEARFSSNSSSDAGSPSTGSRSSDEEPNPSRPSLDDPSRGYKRTTSSQDQTINSTPMPRFSCAEVAALFNLRPPAPPPPLPPPPPPPLPAPQLPSESPSLKDLPISKSPLGNPPEDKSSPALPSLLPPGPSLSNAPTPDSEPPCGQLPKAIQKVLWSHCTSSMPAPRDAIQGDRVQESSHVLLPPQAAWAPCTKTDPESQPKVMRGNSYTLRTIEVPPTVTPKYVLWKSTNKPQGGLNTQGRTKEDLVDQRELGTAVKPGCQPRPTKPNTMGKFHGRTLLMGKGVPPRYIPTEPLYLIKPVTSRGTPQVIPVDPRIEFYKKRQDLHCEQEFDSYVDTLL